MPVIMTETHAGEVLHAGAVELTPISQVLKIQIPGTHTGFTWNRPKAVLVKDADGLEQTLPVVDATRVAIWAMLAGGLLGALAMMLLSRRK